MHIRHLSREPLNRMVLGGVLLLLLTGLLLVIAQLPAHDLFYPERLAIAGYFVSYLAVGLFLVCLRRYYMRFSRDYLFYAFGFLSFAVFQIFEILAFPGFHDVAWPPPSINVALGFDLAARFFLGVCFVVGAHFAGKPNRRLAPGAMRAVLAGWLVAAALATAFVTHVMPGVLFVSEHTTPLKKGLDLAMACPLLYAAGLFWRRYVKIRVTIDFWFAVATVFAAFSGIYASLWHTLYDVSLDAGQTLKVFAFTAFVVAFFAEYVRLLKLENELRVSLEKSREELEKSEKVYRELVEKMADGLFVVDRRGALTFCNQTFAEMVGYPKDELRGMHLSHVFDEQNYGKVAIELEKGTRMSGGQHEVEMITGRGERLPVLINAVPITDAQGHYSGIQAVVTDLTERKKIERELENLVREKTKNIEIFQACIENSTDGILITDPDGAITYVNRAFEEMTGFGRRQLKGETTAVLAYNPRSESVHKGIWRLVHEGKIWHGEFDTRRKDGSGFVGEVSVVPIKDEDDQAVHYLWIENDITRRKALETSLKNYAEELTNKTTELEAAKSYYQTLISGMSDILLVVDNDGNGTFINDYGMNRLGFKADELTKQNLPIFFDDLKRLEREYGSAIRVEVKDFESVIKTKDGESILCSWYAKPLFDSRNRRIGAMAVGRDITEYKHLQNELQDYAKNLENKVRERTGELQQKVNQLAKLLEIGEEIRLNVDIDVILNKICEAVQALGWNKVIISLRNHETRTSRPVAAAGLSPKQVEEVMNWGDIPFEHTERYLQEKYRISNSYFVEHTANLLHQKSPYTVYTELGERLPDEWHAMDALLVPIRTKDKILGIISVDDPRDRHRPTVEKIRDLEIFADKAALAIENARLFQAQKENEKRAKLLADIGKIFHASLNLTEVVEAIVTRGAKAMGDFCTLLLVDEAGELLVPQSTYHEKRKVIDLFLKGDKYFPCRIGEGIIGKVVASGAPVLTSQPFTEVGDGFAESPLHFIAEELNIASLMVLPLRVRGRIIGAMVYLALDANRIYRKEEFKLAQELADRASLAIDNARLFKEAGDKARELEKANKLKSEFLASVSHELRTPLNAIITLSDILIRGIPGHLNQEQIKQLEIIQRSGRHLLELINDILDLSKIEAGKIEPIYSEIPIAAVIEETIEHIRPLCYDKGLALEYECSPLIPKTIYSDQEKVTKALTNLLSNAVKFTEKGKIAVKVDLPTPKELRIEVSDTGIGIPPDRIEEIFNEFQQIDSSDSRKYGGSGLGLAITRKVIEVLGGTISVQSTPGKGSTFTLVLPLKGQPEIVESAPYEKPEHVSTKLEPEVKIDVTDDRNRLDRSKRLVLVIDDEKEVHYVMRQYLKERDYQVIFPQNGEDPVALARTFKPFAITLDILMPERNGWEILDELKHHDDTRHIPVIIASILAEKERAFEMGATEYFVKPFEPEQLLNFLGKLEARESRKRVLLDLPKLWQNRRRRRKRRVAEDGHKDGDQDRILLVDDDRDTQYALRYLLEEAGYQVFVADDGKQAVQKAETIRPNLILMDIMMPDMDGYEATQMLKAREELRGIPVVAMTAKAMKGDREKTLLAGCDDYIAKPFESETILSLVHKWIAEKV